MNLPTLKQLHYLVELQRQQHFGKAAEACHVSQSTLSTAIQNLEETLGVVLLERDNRTLLFTALGLELAQRASQILAQTQELVEFASASQSLFAGPLHLGCIPTIAPFLLPRALQAIHQAFPQLQVYIREDTSANLVQALNQGELELILLALPYPVGTNHTRVLGRDAFYLVHHPDRKLLPPVNYQDLPDGSILLLEETHCLRDHAISACHLSLPHKINTFKANSLHTLVQMVNIDLGISFIPQLAIQQGILDGTVLQAESISEPDNYREIGMVWRPTCFKQQLFHKIAALLQPLLAAR